MLAYLPGRLKVQEIAADLLVTRNTVRTHISSIFRKLDATDRDQAVARATDLGLI